MKYQKILIALLFPIAPFSVIAQKEQARGIYKTSDDFTKGNLSFDNNCKKRISKIKLNDFLSRPYITVKLSDSSLKISKRSIYGYINCRNQFFRFNGKQELLLLNAGEQILIYKHIISKPPTGRTNVTNYYFSLGVSSPVVKLTIKNLKNAFPANLPFHHIIDGNFKYNTDLAGFDEANKIYKINSLLKESLR